MNNSQKVIHHNHWSYLILSHLILSCHQRIFTIWGPHCWILLNWMVMWSWIHFTQPRYWPLSPLPKEQPLISGPKPQKSLPRTGPSAGGFLLPADLTAGTDPRRRLAINHSTDGRVTHMISDWFLWRNVEQRVFNVALFQITFPFATVSKRWICIAVDGAEHKISWIYWGWKRWGRRGPRGRKLPTGTRSIDTFFSPT